MKDKRINILQYLYLIQTTVITIYNVKIII